MTNISKQPLEARQLTQLFAQLSQLIGKSSTADAELILSDLLGPEEKIMLAKRLAAIVMLNRGATIYKTAQALKISPATAINLNSRLEDDQYANLTKLLDKNSNVIIDILETIDTILTLGGRLPYYGQATISGPRQKRE